MGWSWLIGVTFNAAFDVPPEMGENQNPTISGRMSQPPRYLNQLIYRISAADPDGDNLTYELIEGPPGLTVDDMGQVRWLVTRFTPQRVKIKVADSKGGEIIHGFTIPVATTLTPDQPVELSANQGELGLIRFIVPEGNDEPVMQVRLRTADGAGDGDLRVFPPQSFSDVSLRDGSDETLTFASPRPGRWGVWVIGFRDFENITLDFTFPSATQLETNKVHDGFSGVTSSETFYSFAVPVGITGLTVSTGGDTGDLDLYLAKDRYPICQSSRSVSQRCDFDESSAGFLNFEEITIRDEEPSSQAPIKGPARIRVDTGQYFINLSTFSAYDGASLTLALDAGEGIPAISLGGIVNAASFGLAVSPGSIASVFGTSLGEETMAASSVPLPREMAGVKILVDGVEAPLFFVSPGQLNFQAPFEIATPNLGAVSVEVNGVPSALSPFAAILNAPGIFTYNRVPDELDPVIVHADGSLVTPENPARPGEVLIIFATGLGELSNIPATGEATPASPLATLQRTAIVEVGPQESEVLFAGLAPGFVGLVQFNIRLPANMPTGEPALSILIRIQTFESEPVNLHVGAVGGN